MRILVAYESKYGSTKQYAEWIAADLHADVRPLSETPATSLAAYDVVIFGGYLHMGKIVGAKSLIELWGSLAGKRVVLFSVAGAPGNDPQRTVWFENNIPEEIRSNIRHFAFQGRAMNLDWKDSLLMTFPRTMLWIKYRINPSAENKKAYEGFKPFDGVRREAIASLVEYVRGL
jgi:menaquinone-dependent protoporphyrinogen oxidase